MVLKRLAGRGAEPHRRGDRHLPADPRAARRSGGLFRRAGGDEGGDRADPRQARPRHSRCPSSSCATSRDLARGDLGTSLTTGQPVATEIPTRLPASPSSRCCGLHRRRSRSRCRSASSRRRGRARWIDHACRVVTTAGVSLPMFFTGLLLVYVFYYLLGWAPAPLGRLDVFFSAPPHVTGFYLIDSADRRRRRGLLWRRSSSSSCRR